MVNFGLICSQNYEMVFTENFNLWQKCFPVWIEKKPFFYACTYDTNASLLILCYIELESWLKFTYISHSLSKYLKINMVLLATIPKSKNNSPSNPILPYFKIDEQNIKYVNCTICNAKLSRLVKPNQPTFLYYHLIMFHPEIYISDK